MSTPGEDVAVVARAARIRSKTEFEIDGISHAAPGKRVGDEATLIPQLCDGLYLFYCRHFSARLNPIPNRLAARRFVARLSEANAGCGTWDPGWHIMARDDDGRFEVRKDGLAMWVPPEKIISRCYPPRRGSQVRIRIPKEMQALLPGFYLALGDAPPPASPPKIVTRVYWHLSAEVAERALELLTRTLNKFRVPFRLKLVADPQTFTRADAGVLYLERTRYLQIQNELLPLHRTLAPFLLPEVPRFVKPLGRGLGVAEGPEGGESFGQHRCRLIAEGLLDAWRTGRDEAQERVEAVRLAFSKAGLDPDRPYLAPGSSDPYAFSESSP